MLGSVKRALLIVNPYSTQVTGYRITQVERALRMYVEVETVFTQRPGHATELAAAAVADRFDAILVFSGDGTYNEALNGAAGPLPFGFLPGGGTSVLPRALELPAGTAKSYAAKTLWPAGAAAPTSLGSQPTTITLEPFEVLTLELTPRGDA